MEQYLEGEMNGAERQWFKDSGFSAMIPVDNTPEIRAPLVNGGLLHIRRFSLVNSLASSKPSLYNLFSHAKRLFISTKMVLGIFLRFQRSKII